MSFFKNPILSLLLLSVFLSVEVQFFSAEEASTTANSDICKEKNPGYYLSIGLRNQTKAKQMLYYQKKKEAFSLYQDSVRGFENYFRCEKKDKISGTAHLNASVSYLELGEYESAEKQVLAALEKNTKDREAIIIRTKLLIRQAKLKEAEDFLEGKVSSSPEDSDYLFLLGSLNKELGNLNKSVLYFTSLYDSIVNRNGNPRYKIHALKNLADLHYQRGDAKKSLYYYQGYLVLNPRDTNAKFQVAQIFNVLGDFGASRKILQSIQKENPSDKNIELLLAEMHFVESKKTSYPYFQKLVDENKIPKIHLTYALYSVLVGDWVYADGFLREFVPKHEKRIASRLAWLDVLRKRYSKDDLVAELKTVSEIAYSIKQFQIAYNLSRELLELQISMDKEPDMQARTLWFISNCMEQMNSPNRSILYAKRAIQKAEGKTDKEKYQLHLGHLLLGEKIKRYNESLVIADDVLEKNPLNASGHYLKAYGLFLKSNYSSGLASINKAIEIDPNNSGYWFFRGLIYEKLNNLPQVEKNLRKTMELSPDSPVAYNYLGYLYADKKINLEEAHRLIEKAVDLEPDNGAYQDSLGWVFFRKGDIENAIFHLYLAKQMLEDKEIKDFTVYDHLGDVYFAKDEGAIARDYWKKALELSTDKNDKIKIQKKIQNR